jgi:hypothetical protein
MESVFVPYSEMVFLIFKFFLKARSCKSRKALLVLFVRPSVIINSSSHWAGFGEIYCWRILWKSVEKIQTCLKSEKKNRALYTKTEVYLYCWQQYEIFCTYTTMKMEPIVLFSRRHTTVLYCW